MTNYKLYNIASKDRDSSLNVDVIRMPPMPQVSSSSDVTIFGGSFNRSNSRDSKSHDFPLCGPSPYNHHINFDANNLAPHTVGGLAIQGTAQPLGTEWHDSIQAGSNSRANEYRDMGVTDLYGGVYPPIHQSGSPTSSDHTTGRQPSKISSHYRADSRLYLRPPTGGYADIASPSREFAMSDCRSPIPDWHPTTTEVERSHQANANHSQLLTEIKDLAEGCGTLTSQLFSPYCSCPELAFDYAMMALTHEKDLQEALSRVREVVSGAPSTSIPATPSWTYKYGTYLVSLKKNLVKLQQMPATLPMLGKVQKRFESFEAIRLRLLELVANLEVCFILFLHG